MKTKVGARIPKSNSAQNLSGDSFEECNIPRFMSTGITDLLKLGLGSSCNETLDCC